MSERIEFSQAALDNLIGALYDMTEDLEYKNSIHDISDRFGAGEFYWWSVYWLWFESEMLDSAIERFLIEAEEVFNL